MGFLAVRDHAPGFEGARCGAAVADASCGGIAEGGEASEPGIHGDRGVKITCSGYFLL